MTRLTTTLAACVLALAMVSTAEAQQWGAEGQAGGTATAPAGRGSDGMRIAIQGRLDAFNMFGISDVFVLGESDLTSLTILSAFAPTATAGLRMDRLFVGLGLGLVGGSSSSCEDDGCDEETTVSNSGFSLSPMAAFDVLNDGSGALSLGGWLNLGSIGGGTIEAPDGTEISADGYFMWGMSLAAGLRGILTEGLALGSEFGWGFITWSEGDDAGDDSVFVHGLFGTILVEGSVGI